MLTRVRHVILAAAGAVACAGAATAQGPEAPAIDCREAKIPMRDGVRLHTTIIAPGGRRTAHDTSDAPPAGSRLGPSDTAPGGRRTAHDTSDAPPAGSRLGPSDTAPGGAHEALPILLTRTPYGIPACPTRGWLPGYVRVFQDIRGRGGSEGVFVMNRPNREPGDSAAADESTDTWDTVEWLVHNVPTNNGRVGIVGISYPGWLSEEPLIGPHPAVKAVSPQAPMTDTWMGDDFFHQGAFRQSYGFEYGWGMESGMVGAGPLPITGTDAYDWYLSFPSLKALTDWTGAMRIPTWRRFVEHPAYDSVWQRRAFERVVRQLSVPTLLVGGFWDQEDLFGPQATYAALERLDSAGLVHLVIGPWSHGQWGGPGGERLGNLEWGQATSDTFLRQMQMPWFNHWLKGQGDGRFPKAVLFDGGAREWRSFDAWPPREAIPKSLYLRADGALSFDPPTEAAGFDAYVSDPAHPVPYRPRPVEITYGSGSRWSRWMTEDQRFVEARPDVRAWKTEPLTADVTIAGEVVARLFAATTGSDADWVVKLIDVYPDTAAQPGLAGYELMVAGDIMRGRYRESWEHPAAIPPDTALPYTVDLHYQLYTFKRGHRIMVQVQGSWFPLYDRNPQTFVPNIFEAPASAYRAATERIYRTASQPSRVEVTVLPR